VKKYKVTFQNFTSKLQEVCTAVVEAESIVSAARFIANHFANNQENKIAILNVEEITETKAATSTEDNVMKLDRKE
jgi:hypothetical protein